MKYKLKQKIILLILITGLFLARANSLLAKDSAGESAKFRNHFKGKEENLTSKNLYLKKWAIRSVLERYKSPLIEEVDNFILACVTYNFDCYLLPSIAGLESSFGLFVYPNSYNPFGWGGGRIIFSSWAEAIDKVAFGLKNNYINQGASNIWSIGIIYSESPTWASRIDWFMSEFKNEENKIKLFLEKNSVKL